MSKKCVYSDYFWRSTIKCFSFKSEPPKQTGVGQQEQQQVMKSSPSTSKQASISGSGAPVGQVMQNLSPSESRMIIAHVMYNLLSVHEDDRYIAEIFKRVPSAQSYPIYYEVITNPIDFWMIFKKLKVRQFSKDCFTCFSGFN